MQVLRGIRKMGGVGVLARGGVEEEKKVEEEVKEEVEKEEEEGEGVDPTLLGDLHHTVSIKFEN